MRKYLLGWFVGKVLIKLFEQNLISFNEQLTSFYLYKSHFPCQAAYDCLPLVRICDNDPLWDRWGWKYLKKIKSENALIAQIFNLCDTKHGTYVDFSGSGFLQSFGLEAMPLNKWMRLTIYRHAEFGDPDYDDLLFKFKFYDIDDGKLLEETSYADNFEYQYGGNENFKVFGSNPFSTDSDTHCYNSKFCYDSFEGEFKNLYFSDIKSWIKPSFDGIFSQKSFTLGKFIYYYFYIILLFWRSRLIFVQFFYKKF